MEKAAHKGDPCVYCGTPHDEVEPGDCPAFVGVRPPMAGEWFIGCRGTMERARFDFSAQSFPIFKGTPRAYQPDK